MKASDESLQRHFIVLALTALVFVATATESRAGAVNFISANSTWETAAAWSTGAVPTSSNSTIIGGNNPITVLSINSTRQVGSTYFSHNTTGPSTGTFNVLSSANLTINGFFVGQSVNSTSTINQSGGIMNVTGSWRIGNSVAGSSNSTYNLAGGTVNTAVNVELGSAAANTGTHIINISGGTMNATLGLTLGNGTSTGVINMNSGTMTAGNLTIRSASSRLEYSGGTLSVNGISNNGTVSFSNEGSASLSGNISGTGVVTKSGAGQMILSGNNSYIGNTTVSAGSLAVAHNNALGSTAAGTTVASGGQLFLTGVTVGNEALTISGNGLASGSSIAGALRAGLGSNTWGGSVTLAGDAKIFSGSGTSITLDVASGNAVDLGAYRLTIEGAGNHTINDAIVGTGGLTKIGSGITTLAGANTYTGNTTVSVGTLAVNGSVAGEMTVASGATLQGNGTISGATTVSGNLKPGNSPGLLTFENSLTLDSTAITTMEIASLNASGARGVDYDAVDVGGVLTYGGTLVFNFANEFTEANTYTFNLFDFSGTSIGDFTTMSLGGFYSGNLTSNSGVWGLTDGDNTWSFNESDGILTFTVVPEPNVVMLTGSLALMALLRRRRD